MYSDLNRTRQGKIESEDRKIEWQKRKTERQNDKAQYSGREAICCVPLHPILYTNPSTMNDAGPGNESAERFGIIKWHIGVLHPYASSSFRMLSKSTTLG